MAKTVVAGGGIIGLFSAYFLNADGHDVVLIDSGHPVNCSTGNAGMIVPSHVIPLAAPGVVAKGLKWMFSPKSPFSLKFSMDPDWARWGWLFLKSANSKNVQRSFMHLKEISVYSRQLYASFVNTHKEEDFHWGEKGLLMLYRSRHGEKEETGAARVAALAGLEARVLDAAEVRDIEPGISDSVRGGVLYPGDALISPGILTTFLYKYLQEKGVKIVTRREVSSFRFSNGNVVSVIAGDKEYTCDFLVVTAGTRSADIARELSFRLPLMAGKGYSFMSRNTLELKQPAILSERKVTVSPYRDTVRFGGTMEISGRARGVDLRKVKGIAESLGLYYEGAANFRLPEPDTVWSGLRPVSPDGLPYIGKSPVMDNVFFGTGHSMIGVSLAPATGKIISDLIGSDTPDIDISLYSPGRFA